MPSSTAPLLTQVPSDSGGSKNFSKEPKRDFTRLASLLSKLNPFNLVCFGLMVWYAILFYNTIRPYWFHPSWTTDDALQQVYPFHEVLKPGLFQGDLD